MPVALLTALCLALNLAGMTLAIRRAGGIRSVGATAVAWACPFMAFQLFIAIWSGIGLVEQDILGTLAFNAAAVAACQLSVRRAEMHARIDPAAPARPDRTPGASLLSGTAMARRVGMEAPSSPRQGRRGRFPCVWSGPAGPRVTDRPPRA